MRGDQFRICAPHRKQASQGSSSESQHLTYNSKGLETLKTQHFWQENLS